MSLRIAFFGAQSYDINSFEEQNKEFNYDLRFFTGNLNQNNIVLTKDADAVCIFVNDLADRQIIKSLSE